MNTSQSKPLHGMFSAVPPRYDLLNTLMTWNMDKRWRRLAAQACLTSLPRRVLDLCCGTGDLAIEISRIAGIDVEINGLDFSPPMLERARQKAGRSVAKNRIKFWPGDASRMPFPDAHFDSVGISFGIRNLTYQNPLAQDHLSEITRVIKPGGKFVIVESSQPGSRLVRAMYHLYMRQYVGRVGAWISGNKAAYSYLAESACRYYSPPEMETLLLENGFSNISYRPLFFGSAGIYSATKSKLKA